MGDPSPTDVLSFPLDAEAGIEASIDDVPLLLGDVVVCPAVAMRNAPDHAGSIIDELALLVVHGTLHVLGHDHADLEQEREMQARERELLEQHHWRGEAPATFQAHGRR
jgi:probable rRNA maturation factor